MSSWADLQSQAPGLAAFGADRLTVAPAFLATLRRDGTPRVHPVAPIIGAGHLFVFMEPTSPKGHDLRERGSYALHNGVADNDGTGGEFFLSGFAHESDDPQLRAAARTAASYEPADRYILFVLGINEARANGYGDVRLPDPARWVGTRDNGLLGLSTET